ncbi:MAG: DUF192 domain-containing protein [Balneolaceae bacterium]
MYKLIIPFLLLQLSACSGSDRPQSMEESVTRELDFTSEVHFRSSDGTQTISTIRVAVAQDEHSRSEGLMNINSLPSDAGMLFIFENDQHRSFWMANTPLSLDILYVNSDFEIVRIHRNTSPYSQEQIRSEAPAKYVVEVNAGYTLRNDITEGMKISIAGLE